MHILIAPNAFKNSLPADAVATAILQGLEQSGFGFTGECFPVGDGGDGTGELLMRKLGATRCDVLAHDPIGRERPASFGLTADGTSIIEMATASGIHLLDKGELDPLHATSRGTGDLIRAALDRQARQILLGIGGSATIDGGMGILTALGMRFLDDHGLALSTPADLPRLARLESSGLDPRLQHTSLTILCDVTNPPLGPGGAAAVFGPQKGASPEDVVLLESALQRLCAVIRETTGVGLSRMPLGGAAGAAAGGLHGLLGARLVKGIDYFLQITDFDASLQRSNLVITGEGSVDAQTLQGKAPYGVAVRAKARGIPVIALTGRRPDDPAPLRAWFDEIIPINPPQLPLSEAIASTASNLAATARALGGRLAARKPS
jgi:glycerate kinase